MGMEGKACGLEQEVGNGRRRRGKKPQKGPKKVPQRGLGVAKLEKLRLQEQKLQESACFAAAAAATAAASHGLHALSFSSTAALAEQGGPYGWPCPSLDQNVEVCNETRGQSLVSLHKMPPGSLAAITMPNELTFAQSRNLDTRVVYSAFKDKALSDGDLISASALTKCLRSSLSFALPESIEGNDAAQSSISRVVDTSSLDSNLSSPLSVKDHSNENPSFGQKEDPVDGLKDAHAVTISSLSSIDDFSPSTKSTISNGVPDQGFTKQGIVFQLQSAVKMDQSSAQGEKKQKPLPALHDSGGILKNLAYASLVKGYAFNNLEENGGGNLSNLQLLNSSFEPPDKSYFAVNQLRPSAMGISSFGEMPKELSSFQNCYSSQNSLASAEKMSERKRPWLALQHPSLFDITLKDLVVPVPQGFDDHLKHQIVTAQPSDGKAIRSSSGGLLWIPAIPNGSYPDPHFFLDVKKKDGIKNVSSQYGSKNVSSQYDNATVESGLWTTPDSFLSLGISSLESADNWKASVLLTNELTDMMLHHPIVNFESKEKRSSITPACKSEDFQSVEQKQPGAPYKHHQSLDLTLKLAL